MSARTGTASCAGSRHAGAPAAPLPAAATTMRQNPPAGTYSMKLLRLAPVAFAHLAAWRALRFDGGDSLLTQAPQTGEVVTVSPFGPRLDSIFAMRRIVMSQGRENVGR